MLVYLYGSYNISFVRKKVERKIPPYNISMYFRAVKKCEIVLAAIVLKTVLGKIIK